MQLQGAAQQVLAALTQSSPIEYATLVTWVEQRFEQKDLAPVKKQELRNHIQKSGEELQDYAAEIRRLAQEAYTSMDPEFV